MSGRTLAEWIGDDSDANLHISDAFMELDAETQIASLLTLGGAAIAYALIAAGGRGLAAKREALEVAISEAVAAALDQSFATAADYTASHARPQ